LCALSEPSKSNSVGTGWSTFTFSILFPVYITFGTFRYKPVWHMTFESLICICWSSIFFCLQWEQDACNK
jgi:hypothetical protein